MNLSKVWTIAVHEYLLNLRRTGFIVWTLAVPALAGIGLLIATFFGGQAGDFFERQFGGQDLTVGVVDHSGLYSPILPEYADQFVPYESRQAGREALAAEQIDSLLIISENYLETGDVTIVTRDGNMNVVMADESDDFLAEHLLFGNVSPEIAERVLHPSVPDVVSLAQEIGEESSGGGIAGMIAGFIVPYFLGILLVITIFTSSGYLLRSVSEEKTSRVIEIVLSSVTAQELLAGKVLGLGALGLTQIAVWLGTAFAFSGGMLGMLGVALPALMRPQLFILSLVYYLLGFLIFAVIMGAAGALGTSEQESQQLAGVFSFAAAIPMMLGGFIISNPNMIIARVLSWIPLTAPTMMMLRLSMGGVPTIDIIGSIALSALSVPFIIWVGAKVFRVGLLMYGKRPSVKEIWKLVRQA